MKAEIDRMASLGVWRDKWAVHPFPNSSEALKAMCYLTDFGDYDADHKARLYMKATLHPIDRFFQQVRRRLSLLERPIATASKFGRTWYGYSAYLPENIEKVLAIFRVYYNYCLAGKDGQTPAMRLGLARAVVDPQEILYYVPKPDEPEPNRQKTSSVVRKIVGRSTDLRPCKCSRASREKCRNPLGLEAFCLLRLGRWFDFGTLQFFSQIAKTQLVSD